MKIKGIGASNTIILFIICLFTFVLGLVSLASREQFIEWKSHLVNFSIHTLGIAAIALLPLCLLLIMNLAFQLIKMKNVNWQQLMWLSIFGISGILVTSFLSTCILWLN